jgi:hypothetical protein
MADSLQLTVSEMEVFDSPALTDEGEEEGLSVSSRTVQNNILQNVCKTSL